MARPKGELFYMQNSCTMAEWVKEYHNNSRIVMEYLLSNEIKTTAYYSSIKCLEQLKAYLLEKEEIYSHSKAIEWLSTLQPDQKPHYLITVKRLNEMELPMPTEVGNAIYLYLKCRTSNSEYLFAKNKMPFNNVCKQVCNTALSSVLPERNVKGSGFHVTRRTFATDQLKSSVKQNTIKDLLGHRDGDQLMKYLNLDSERMFLCPLSLEETNICMEVKRYD